MFVRSLAYNLSDLSGPIRNMKVPADIACKINETHKPPYHDKVLTSFEKELKTRVAKIVKKGNICVNNKHKKNQNI